MVVNRTFRGKKKSPNRTRLLGRINGSAQDSISSFPAVEELDCFWISPCPFYDNEAMAAITVENVLNFKNLEKEVFPCDVFGSFGHIC